MLPTLHGPLPLADYLPSEIASEFWREYVAGYWYGLHGESYEQDGTSMDHNAIMLNAMTTLFPACDRKAYGLMSSQYKLHIPERQSFFYPDLAVYRRENLEEWYGTQPLFLLEIIEPRSEFVDRCLKFHAYTAIPTLQVYLIAEQDRRHVTVFQREQDGWVMAELKGEGVVKLPFLNTELTLDEVYDGIENDPAGVSA